MLKTAKIIVIYPLLWDKIRKILLIKTIIKTKIKIKCKKITQVFRINLLRALDVLGEGEIKINNLFLIIIIKVLLMTIKFMILLPKLTIKKHI